MKIKLILQSWVRNPFFWVGFLSVLLRLPGLAWGLPASDGWDDDGVAPRNFLVGLAQTYAPGAYFTYPPLHMVWLALLGLPAIAMALLHAPTLTQHDVIAEFIHVPYMTFFALTARLLSLVMSVATIAMIGKLTEKIAGRMAGVCAAATCALDAALVYYGQVSNLDGPYLFWAVLAVWFWVRVLVDGQLQKLRWVIMAMVAAVTTKDQAYAVFLLPLPVSLVYWIMRDPIARRNRGAILRATLGWGSVGAVLLLLIDGALTNPTGFARRLAFLRGPASQDYAAYTPDLAGHLRLFADMALSFPRFYPGFGLVLAVLGGVLMWRRSRGQPALRAAGFVPALAVVSFTVFFNCVALRTDNRFLLPQSVFLAPYIGIAVSWLLTSARGGVLPIARCGVAALAIMALYQCMGLDAAMIDDPRYNAEYWMAGHVQTGAPMEAYGRNAFLPRLPAHADVTRIDVIALRRRNPMPGVREVMEPFEQIETRKPQVLVIPQFWVRDYLSPAGQPAPGYGRKRPTVEENQQRDEKDRAFFSSLFGGEQPYHVAYVARYASSLWPVPQGYESLGQTVFLFERTPAALPAAP
ncbi:hypothetical protein [Acetobacter sp.]|uniref:hypothetical protein n=1 Tax=Acetobacter sp. TaxID=440 RepID=UPI0039EB4C9E